LYEDDAVVHAIIDVMTECVMHLSGDTCVRLFNPLSLFSLIADEIGTFCKSVGKKTNPV